MKLLNRIILLSLVMVCILYSQCGTDGKKNKSGNASADTGVAKIVFREYEHSFGKVTEGEKVGYVFKYENQGSADLIIASVSTTCGCTVPEYDTRPVRPGGEGNIEVVFDTSGRNGMQTKTISVKSNAEQNVVILKITAEVVGGIK